MNILYFGFDPTPIDGLWLYRETPTIDTIYEMTWELAKRLFQISLSCKYTTGHTQTWDSGGFRDTTDGGNWHWDNHGWEYILMSAEGESTQWCQHEFDHNIYQPPPYSIVLVENIVIPISTDLYEKPKMFHRTPPRVGRTIYRYPLKIIDWDTKYPKRWI